MDTLPHPYVTLYHALRSVRAVTWGRATQDPRGLGPIGERFGVPNWSRTARTQLCSLSVTLPHFWRLVCLPSPRPAPTRTSLDLAPASTSPCPPRARSPTPTVTRFSW